MLLNESHVIQGCVANGSTQNFYWVERSYRGYTTGTSHLPFHTSEYSDSGDGGELEGCGSERPTVLLPQAVLEIQPVDSDHQAINVVVE